MEILINYIWKKHLEIKSIRVFPQFCIPNNPYKIQCCFELMYWCIWLDSRVIPGAWHQWSDQGVKGVASKLLLGKGTGRWRAVSMVLSSLIWSGLIFIKLYTLYFERYAGIFNSRFWLWLIQSIIMNDDSYENKALPMINHVLFTYGLDIGERVSTSKSGMSTWFWLVEFLFLLLNFLHTHS